MTETNINAYKQELVEAESDLDRATARVESLKAHIVSVEDEPAPADESDVKETVKDESTTKVSSFKKKGKK